MRATGVVGDEERSFLVKERSGDEIKRYLEAHPEREEDLMTVLSYFDPMRFANDVRCPTLVGLGLLDDVVPAPRSAPSPDLSADRTRSSICPSATPSCPRSSCGTTSRRTGSAWR